MDKYLLLKKGLTVRIISKIEKLSLYAGLVFAHKPFTSCVKLTISKA